MEFTRETIEEKFEALPRDMQNAISDKEVTAILRTIGERHRLRLDAIGFLIEETGLVMLGLVPAEKFSPRLAAKIGITKEESESITVDIDEEVFRKVRDSLRQVQYRGTVDKRFTEASDFPAKKVPDEEPERDALLQEVEKEGANETPGIEAIQKVAPTYASTADYNPEEFGSTSKSEPVISENIIPTITSFEDNYSATSTPVSTVESGASTVAPTVPSVVAPTVGPVSEATNVQRPEEEKDNVFNFEKEESNKDETEVKVARPEVNVSFKDKLQQKITEQKQSTPADSYREPIG